MSPFTAHIDSMSDTDLLDAFEQMRATLYWSEWEWRGKTEEGWTCATMCGPEGPGTYPTMRAAMRAELRDHFWSAFFGAREEQRKALLACTDIH